MRICVIGLWHLGCVTAACLAKKGVEVIGVADSDQNRSDLQSGKAPVFEPGLDELMYSGINSEKLSFTIDSKEAIESSDYIWVCTDTPVDEDDIADVDYVVNQIKECVKYARSGQGFIVSSQLPVGTIREIENYVLELYPNKNIRFACSPENLRLGKAIEVFLNPDRIIIGVRNESDKASFKKVFDLITEKQEWMNIESAEMTKHAINCFLATSVVFINEIASICEVVGADATEVSRGLKTEQRIGPKAYLSPGGAFAGGTLARDLRFLKSLSSKYDVCIRQIEGTFASNIAHKDWIYKKLVSILNPLSGIEIGVLGLAYKKGTSTLRRSMSIEISKMIASQGGHVLGYDPYVQTIPQELDNTISLLENLSEMSHRVKAVVVMTDYEDFKAPIMECISLSIPVIDENGYYKKELTGITNYYTVGKGI